MTLLVGIVSGLAYALCGWKPALAAVRSDTLAGMPKSTVGLAFVGSVTMLVYMYLAGITDIILWANAILGLGAWAVLVFVWARCALRGGA
jgi:hypothetical protein